LIQAAGGVVARDGQVVVVHRPRYDDWTLPKGKLEAGETSADAAVREVLEETGLQCNLGTPLGATQHLQNGIDKQVEWFRMEPVLDTGRHDDEVDAVRWLSVPEALALLSYESERELLGRL
jgi:8-oxo-dGTP pyrophosphatase MutT (NUDIX family)